jgi:hypothetical protein
MAAKEVTGILRKVDITVTSLEFEDESGKQATYEFLLQPQSVDYYLLTNRKVTLRIEEDIVQEVIIAD